MSNGVYREKRPYHRYQKTINHIHRNYQELNALQRIVKSYFDKMCDELKNEAIKYFHELMGLFDEYTLIDRENKLGQSQFLTDNLYGLQMKLLEHFGIYAHFEDIEHKIIWSEKIIQNIIFNRKYVYRQIFQIVFEYDNERHLEKEDLSFDEKMDEAIKEDVDNAE